MEGSNYRLTRHQKTCLQDLIKFWDVVDIALTYRINNRGVRMLPSGTPADMTGAQSD